MCLSLISYVFICPPSQDLVEEFEQQRTWLAEQVERAQEAAAALTKKNDELTVSKK